MKKVTVGEFLDALEANNIPLKRGGWFSDEYAVTARHVRGVGSACILGQACINLAVTDTSLQNALHKVKPNSASTIISMNDSTTTLYVDMVKKARKLFEGLEDKVLELETTTYLVKLIKSS